MSGGWSSARLLAEVPGLSYRQLNHWLYQGYVPGGGELLRGSGRQRVWSPEQILHIRHMAHLVGLGLRPEVAAEAAAGAVLSGERVTWPPGQEFQPIYSWRWGAAPEVEAPGRLQWRLPRTSGEERAAMRVLSRQVDAAPRRP